MEKIYIFIIKVVPLVITLIGYIFGITKIFKKKSSFFFTLIIYAVGCFLIEQISLTVNYICDVYDDVWIGVLGVFGCNLFLLSANYNLYDKIIIDKKIPIHKKLLAFIVPLILVISMVSIFLIWKDSNMMCAIVFPLLLLPAIPASYYIVNCLLVKEDKNGILKAVNGCEIMSLVFILITIIYLFIEATGSVVGIFVASVILSITVLGLSVVAVKGARKWEI